MTLRHSITIPAMLAGVLYMTNISPVHGQAFHGQSISAPMSAISAPPVTNIVAVAEGGGALKADFDTLAFFAFEAPDAAITNQAAFDKEAKKIPEAIKKLDGKVVRITGFMMPVKESDGKTTEFLIMQNQPSCCFSGATALNQFVTVKSSGQGVKENMDDAVAIEGTLHVGLMTDSGFIVGLYRMDGA